MSNSTGRRRAWPCSDAPGQGRASHATSRGRYREVDDAHNLALRLVASQLHLGLVVLHRGVCARNGVALHVVSQVE
eukprot:3677257-Rhodomonas_salina.4